MCVIRLLTIVAPLIEAVIIRVRYFFQESSSKFDNLFSADRSKSCVYCFIEIRCWPIWSHYLMVSKLYPEFTGMNGTTAESFASWHIIPSFFHCLPIKTFLTFLCLTGSALVKTLKTNASNKLCSEIALRKKIQQIY